jgi:hypothetical protein
VFTNLSKRDTAFGVVFEVMVGMDMDEERRRVEAGRPLEPGSRSRSCFPRQDERWPPEKERFGRRAAGESSGRPGWATSECTRISATTQMLLRSWEPDHRP